MLYDTGFVEGLHAFWIRVGWGFALVGRESFLGSLA